MKNFQTLNVGDRFRGSFRLESTEIGGLEPRMWDKTGALWIRIVPSPDQKIEAGTRVYDLRVEKTEEIQGLRIVHVRAA